MSSHRGRALAGVACAVSLIAVPAAAAAPLDGFVHYDQNAPEWGAKTYKPGGTMAATGCGPTAVAMAVRHLTGRVGVDPMTIANRFGAEYHQKGRGSYHSLIRAAGSAYGLRVRAYRTDLSSARRSIRRGGLVIALVTGRPFTWGGHFIVLTAFRDGKFRISDPNRRNNHLERRGFTAAELRAGSVAKMWGYSGTKEGTWD